MPCSLYCLCSSHLTLAAFHGAAAAAAVYSIVRRFSRQPAEEQEDAHMD